jgi:guanosine-3',5'-bis(diphosphate) 3'-pyrophosphohydrolase
MSAIDPRDSEELERAILFLANAWERTGQNSKPTLFHSLRVAFSLLEMGYPAKYAKIAVLHDILEDTAVTPKELEDEFDADVVNAVIALSYRDGISDWKSRYLDLFQRTFAFGEMTVVVKAMDIIDNSQYINQVDDKDFRRKLLEKINQFLMMAESYRETPVIKRLHIRYEEELSVYEQ